MISLSGGASRFLKRDIVWHEQKTKNAKITIHCHHMMDTAQLTECKRSTVGKREFLIVVLTEEFLSALTKIFIDPMTDQ